MFETIMLPLIKEHITLELMRKEPINFLQESVQVTCTSNKNQISYVKLPSPFPFFRMGVAFNKRIIGVGVASDQLTARHAAARAGT
jgi:hypothetical protein